MDWLHLISTGVWAGGLLALTLVLKAGVPILKPGSGQRTQLLGLAIPIFSQMAIVCVVLLLVTGTIGATFHFDSPRQLFSTSYGLSLLAKLGLLVPLLLLGAYNLFSANPRLQGFVNSEARSRKKKAKEGPGSLAAGILGLNFRRSVMAEVVLAFLILFASAFLTSYSPPKSLNNSSFNALHYQSEANGLKVELAISPGYTGHNTFEASILDTEKGKPAQDIELVEIRFKMVVMEKGQTRVELKPVKGFPGRYSGEGLNLLMIGTWETNFIIHPKGKFSQTYSDN